MTQNVTAVLEIDKPQHWEDSSLSTHFFYEETAGPVHCSIAQWAITARLHIQGCSNIESPETTWASQAVTGL
ncbi:hypothetical protein N7499_003898 [Penicillium canescens]|uniref:Uncharacterized protein n=1 Tax=Penicillium canescens TaxID=5083 RepID=A0AAD6IMX8_PENCN|nr:uncharacterized protein N7446_007404 [Penicillium canescens]KAJ6049267.1 hypothetical protein N7444_005983 [Penicillium canescens]KAJ6052760.1 hypothetical protein N7460_003294 [Penicillium canescens]KAJ6063284.1 hypothetical protein N7446_007404 [Penicillium canescens]KAJ6089051.1 hypothetical protein N7499_003898 [Penicillium canescens]